MRSRGGICVVFWQRDDVNFTKAAMESAVNRLDSRSRLMTPTWERPSRSFYFGVVDGM